MSEAPLRSEQTKSWKTVAIFSTYEEAKDKKNTLIEEHASVKIKRGKSSNKEVYRVKVWNPEPPKKKSKKNKKRT
jgi:hypothetical protein